MWGRMGAREVDRTHTTLPAALLGLALRLGVWVGAHALLDLALRTWMALGLFDLVHPGVLVLGELVYVTLVTLVSVEPDMDDLGLGRGMLDHPLRASDDWNRRLLALMLFLEVAGGLGRWLGTGFVRILSALLHGSKRSSLPELPPPPPDTRRPIEQARPPEREPRRRR